MSERPLDDAVDGFDGIIWQSDPRSGRFTYVSGRAESILGYPVEQWLSEPGFWPRMIHPDDREHATRLCREAVAALRDHTFEYRAITADGRTVWLRDHAKVVTDRHGRLVRLEGVMVDITSERQADGSARDAVERMRAVATAGASLIGAQSMDELYSLLRTACDSIFASDVVSIGLYHEDSDALEILGDPAGGVVAAFVTVPLQGSAVEPVVRQGRSLLAGRSTDPAARRLRSRQGLEVESVMRVPMRRGQRVLGVLSVLSHARDVYSRSDLAALEALAALVAAAVVNIRFITETRSAEAALRESGRFQKLLQLVTSAANEAGSFEEAATRCMSAICRHTGWATAHVFMRTPDGELVSTGLWERNNPAPGEGAASASQIRYQYGMGLVGRVVESGRPVWIEDVSRDPTFLHPAGGAEVRGAFAFPVTVGDRVAAVVEFFSRTAVAADPALLDAAGRIGVQLGRVLERGRAAEQIRYQARLLDAVGQAVVASDVNHRIIYWNPAAETLYGYTREEAIGKTDSELVHARADSDQTAEITARLAAGETWAGEFVIRRKNGTTVPVHITGSVLHDAAGSPIGYVGIATDLSRSKALEAQLRQAQKLEAVGRLAGGVAHDFNNLLTAIKGTTHLLLDDFALDNPLRVDLEQIQRSADRAAALTNQLLAFSRRQVMQPRRIDLNAIINELCPVLERLAGDEIRIETALDPNLGTVRVDPQQIGQALTHLVSNARQAMGGCGRIVIRTSNAELTRTEVRRYAYDVRPGRYVVFSVQDFGPGVDEDELEHIFDPFYATRRRAGRGDLGLSTVYGIVKQSGGYVWVDSRVAQGTTFRVYLPRVHSGPDTADEPRSHRRQRGSETLLLVEDEETVRKLAHKILARQGYSVLVAANGVEALQVCDEHPDSIDLVVTDVVMPEMGGGELAERLKEIRPDLPVLMMSGYAEDAVLRHGIAESHGRFLEKPFTPEALVRKVREVLDSGTPAPAAAGKDQSP